MGFLRGYKTYLVAGVAAALAAAQALGFDVPPWVMEGLAALGLYTMRRAVEKSGE